MSLRLVMYLKGLGQLEWVAQAPVGHKTTRKKSRYRR